MGNPSSYFPSSASPLYLFLFLDMGFIFHPKDVSFFHHLRHHHQLGFLIVINQFDPMYGDVGADGIPHSCWIYWIPFLACFPGLLS